jgi:hypothetical protein
LQKFLVIFSLLFSSILIGQNKVELEIIVKTDSIINSINVINLTQQTGSILLPYEKFKFTVQKNDTLLFSALNLQNKIIVIDSEII